MTELALLGLLSFLTEIVALRSPLDRNLLGPLIQQDALPYFDTVSSKSAPPRHRRSAQMPEVTHLELLVVVGPDVHSVHRQDTEKYILTNLNIASELLRDVSLGANLRIDLVRMIILTDPEPEIQISSNISSSLKSVCEWGQKVNPSDDADPLHADLLLYITRFDLELPDGNKLVRGVTKLGGVCSSQWSCIITEDTGFDLAITIAHEIGHSFNMSHDGVDNTCGGSGFIMSSDGGYNSVDLTWSQCSRTELENFFSAGKADCVKDLPVLEGSLQDWKPGLYYGIDDQCRIAFGSTARACSFTNNNMEICRVLSCHVGPGDQSSCSRLLVPLLDGTECGPNQWCLKGNCVSPSKLSSSIVVHGSWSQWSEFSPCSRTCGGGITYRKRECNNPRPAFGGTECVGKDTEAELCHRQSCENTQLDFMAQQCSETDNQPLYLSPDKASVYSWIPAVGYTTGDMQCKLMCLSREEDFMVSRGPQFTDGTRCEPDTAVQAGSVAACLNGKCQVFGCDGVLHSGKTVDVCGVCGGNGSTCHLTSQSYGGGEAREYVTFLTLPLNATRVHVVNKRPLFTHLAVLMDDQYVVAGSGSVASNTTHPSVLEDGPLVYRLYLTPDHLPHTEELLLPGPVGEKTLIQVYRKYGKEYGEQTSPLISYQYHTPVSGPVETSPRGMWSTVQSPCSVTCGTGIQSIAPVCVDMVTLKRLEESLCGSGPNTTTEQKQCHQPDCPPRWEVGEFGLCSAPCGGGQRVRPVRCTQIKGTATVEVPFSECPDDSKPAVVSICNLQPCPARWRVSEPGECSAVCGPGEARRSVVCVRSHRGVEVETEQSLCSEPRPPENIPCVVDVCPIGWETQPQKTHKKPTDVMTHSRKLPVYVWSPVIGQCSKTCGNGSMQIHFSCVDHESRLEVPQSECDPSSKPESYTESCNPSPCPATWRFIQGVCSVPCGGGMARRVLYCSQQIGGSNFEMVVKDSACQSVPRPPVVIDCNTKPCPARWLVKGRGPCSVSCGLGAAHRQISCVQFERGKEREVEEDKCELSRRPPVTVPCLEQVCSFTWEMEQWNQCSVTCGYGIQSRAVFCKNPTRSEPVSPLLCLHVPKPITVRACHGGDCPSPPTKTWPFTNASLGYVDKERQLTGTSQSPEPQGGVKSEKPLGTEPPTTPTPRQTATPRYHSALPPTVPQMTSAMVVSTTPPQTNICGKLLLQDSGTIDLRNVKQQRCIFGIGRPVGEAIRIQVDTSTLDCSRKESIAFYDRLILVRFCDRVEGRMVTSRSNVLLIRQSRITTGKGVVLSYHSVKKTKRTHHEGCDIQKFGPTGIIENPTKSSSQGPQTCRVFIDAPPSMKIRIRALSVFNGTEAPSTYVLIRDVDALRSTIFKGNQLFLWSSSGSRAEVEFHGKYQQIKGTFRAEYSFV